jgi:hypothetical protein
MSFARSLSLVCLSAFLVSACAKYGEPQQRLSAPGQPPPPTAQPSPPPDYPPASAPANGQPTPQPQAPPANQ